MDIKRSQMCVGVVVVEHVICTTTWVKTGPRQTTFDVKPCKKSFTTFTFNVRLQVLH